MRCAPKSSAHTPPSLAPNVAAAHALAKQLAALPQVARTMRIDSFVPADQPPKLARIAAAATSLQRALNPPTVKPAPTDKEIVAALRGGAQNLRDTAGSESGEGAKAARRLADD